MTLSDGTTAEVVLPSTLADAQLGPKAEKAVYGALTLKHQYVGAAVYTTEFEVTEETQGRYELFLERVLWKSTVTFDDRPVGRPRR